MALATARQKAKAAQEILHPIGVPVVVQGPAEAELRTKYADAEQDRLKEYHIQRVSYSARPLDEIFRMAVARGFTFEETKAGVVGLQDCVILLSAFDHLRADPTSAAFVSHDSIFSRIPEFMADFGVDLRFIPGLAALDNELDAAHDAAFSIEHKRWWAEETERIMGVLEAHRERIQAFFHQTIDATEIEKLFNGSVVTAQPPEVQRFGYIRPELQAADDESIRFSSGVSVSWTAIVEQRSDYLGIMLGLQTPAEAPPPVQITQSRSATIELAAQVSADYTELKLQAARISDHGFPRLAA